ELREVMTDDLLRAIPVDALGAHVPGRDVSGRIEHEDRVVLHAVDQQPVALLRLEARGLLVLRALAIGEVARDLREPDEVAIAIAHRADRDVRPEPAAVLANAPTFLLVVPFGAR